MYSVVSYTLYLSIYGQNVSHTRSACLSRSWRGGDLPNEADLWVPGRLDRFGALRPRRHGRAALSHGGAVREAPAGHVLAAPHPDVLRGAGARMRLSIGFFLRKC